MFIVPKGVEHCTFEDAEVHALLVELVGVANTGDGGGSLTVTSDDSRYPLGMTDAN